MIIEPGRGSAEFGCDEFDIQMRRQGDCILIVLQGEQSSYYFSLLKEQAQQLARMIVKEAKDDKARKR